MSIFHFQKNSENIAKFVATFVPNEIRRLKNAPNSRFHSSKIAMNTVSTEKTFQGSASFFIGYIFSSCLARHYIVH